MRQENEKWMVGGAEVRTRRMEGKPRWTFSTYFVTMIIAK